MVKIVTDSSCDLSLERCAELGVEMLPKPAGGSPIPLYVTGHCGQTPEWIAEHGDGWMYYGQDLDTTAKLIRGWRDNVARACGTDDGGVDVVKPYITTLTLDLLPDPDAEPKPLRYGFRAGRTFLLRYLERLAGLGVDHVILGLRASRRPVPDVLDELGEHVFPVYPR